MIFAYPILSTNPIKTIVPQFTIKKKYLLKFKQKGEIIRIITRLIKEKLF